MDTMETTKFIAGICGALLIFLGVRYFVAEPIYHGGHGETEAAYVLEVAEAPAEAPAAAEAVDYAALVAAADVAEGEKLFSKCKSCHKVEAGANGVGPSLHAVAGRAIGGIDGFGYSDAMKSHGGTWTPEALAEFLHAPKAYVPGTKMSFAGFKDPAEAAAMAAWLATVK